MRWDEADPGARVLVCVVHRRTDFERIHTERWYHIPRQHAPAGLAAAYLAFYPTAACGPERWAIRWIAPVLAIQLAQRIDLLPADVQHPRAQERYYRLELDQFAELPAPITSQRLRRITFIPTTLAALLRARDVAELWRAATPDAPELWGGGIGRRAMR